MQREEPFARPDARANWEGTRVDVFVIKILRGTSGGGESIDPYRAVSG